MAESLREKSVRGVAWSAVESFSLTGVQFVISIILARLLAPSDYGMVAMFFFEGIFSILFWLGVYWCLRRWFPKSLRLLTGGR